MTSLQTHIAQIPGRVRYFLAITDTSGYTVNTGKSALSLMDNGENATTSFGEVLTVDDEAVVGGDVMRDMGKSITVIDATTKQQVALYRLVQKQSDGSPLQTEGANLTGDAYLPFYVKVWDSNGTDVTVVRTG